MVQLKGSMERKLGILHPIFSLWGKYGIGTFGESAYKFVDYLAIWGAKVWQVLPICPIGCGASPYSSPCGEAINPYYIDLDLLVDKGLLTKEECECVDFGTLARVDYQKLDHSRIMLLKKAFGRYKGEVKGHLDYALFMTLKEAHGGAPWQDWGRFSDYGTAIKEFYEPNRKEVEFWQFVQTEALMQWNALKEYAFNKGVEIIGDMPFYVAHDSVEAWRNKSLFLLDDSFNPRLVAGVPPDYFSKTGQLWGNPVYDWDSEEVKNWWNERLKKALSMFDRIRLDHFRAFDEFYAIPFGSKDATVGEWKKGPGMPFFKDKLHLPIIAEDLGIITHSVRKLLINTGYPGMRVIQFGFDGSADNPHLPSNVSYNCVCYTGTHDNMPLMQFINSLSEEEYKNFTTILGKECGHDVMATNTDELIDRVIELGCATEARLFIVPLIDLLHKGEEYRINTPSTVSPLNWSARVMQSDLHGLSEKIHRLKKAYNRT